MENFPCGGKQEVVEAGWAGPWRALCKGAPRFIHLTGFTESSRGAQCGYPDYSAATKLPTL